MSSLRDTPVVTCFLRHRAEVLLLRRSQKVGSYRGRWGGVAGHVEEGDAEASAWREIEEETGLVSEVELVRRGEPFSVEDEELGKRWIVHPFLFDVASRDVELDWESVEGEWVPPTEILKRNVVPNLWTSYSRVAPSIGSIREDREHGAAYLSARALEVLRDRAGALASEGDRDRRKAWRDLADLARELAASRPSMVVLTNRVNRLMSQAAREREPGATERLARELLESVFDADAKASAAAAELVRGERVLTLSRSSTVLDALVAGEPALVVVAESRPGREGVGTAESLASAGLSVSLAADSALADAAARLDVSVVLIGADAVLPDGSVVNKTGTHVVGLVARERGIPFYAVAAVDKISVEEEIELEPGEPSDVYDGDADIAADWRLFEVTPAELVASIVTERGGIAPGGLDELVEELRALRSWR